MPRDIDAVAILASRKPPYNPATKKIRAKRRASDRSTGGRRREVDDEDAGRPAAASGGSMKRLPQVERTRRLFVPAPALPAAARPMNRLLDRRLP